MFQKQILRVKKDVESDNSQNAAKSEFHQKCPPVLQKKPDQAPPCLPALECLYCIAKRIFVGSNSDLISRVPIEDRFEILDPDFEGLQGLQLENLVIISKTTQKSRLVIPFS